MATTWMDERGRVVALSFWGGSTVGRVLRVLRPFAFMEGAGEGLLTGDDGRVLTRAEVLALGDGAGGECAVRCERCERCDNHKPRGQSCPCFDNGSE